MASHHANRASHDDHVAREVERGATAALKRDAKAMAISSLNLLSTAYTTDAGICRRIQSMLEQLSTFPTGLEDVKLVPQASMVVIGEAVDRQSSNGEGSNGEGSNGEGSNGEGSNGEGGSVSFAAANAAIANNSAASAASRGESSKGSATSDAERKRPRRAPPAEPSAPLLANCPVGECEVQVPRHDGDQRWDEWCTVIGHTALGQLLVDIPGEEPLHLSLNSRAATTVRRVEAAAAAAATSSAASSSSTAVAPGAMDIDAQEEDEEVMIVKAEGAPAPPAAPPAAPPSVPLQMPEASQLSAGEQLASTALRTSLGRTRERLNQRLDDLPGLHSVFGQTVVSGKASEGGVSHLTFNIELWNDLPADESVPFQWWLGEGEVRLRLASLINPEERPQPEGGVPVFFAHKRKKGGALCHYGGHFTTRSFQRLDKSRVFKGIARQALIELAFHRFDERLAAAIDAIPEED